MPEVETPSEIAEPAGSVAPVQTNSDDEDEVEIIKQICGRPTRSGRLPRPAIKSTEDEVPFSASFSPLRPTKISPARPTDALSKSPGGGLVSPTAVVSSSLLVSRSPAVSCSMFSRLPGTPGPKLLSTPRPAVAGFSPAGGLPRMVSPLTSSAAAGIVSPGLLGVDRLPSGVYVVLESPQPSSATGGDSSEGHKQVLYHIFAEMSPASTPPPSSPLKSNTGGAASNPSGPAIRPLHTAAHAFSGPRAVRHPPAGVGFIQPHIGGASNVRTFGPGFGLQACNVGSRTSPTVVGSSHGVRHPHVFAYPGAPPVHNIIRPATITSPTNLPIIPSLQFQPLIGHSPTASSSAKSVPASLVSGQSVPILNEVQMSALVADTKASKSSHPISPGGRGMTQGETKSNKESASHVLIATKQQDGTVVILAEPSKQLHSASTGEHSASQPLNAMPVVGSEAAGSAPTIRVIEHADGSTELLIDGNLCSVDETGVGDDDSQYIDVVVEHYPYNESV